MPGELVSHRTWAHTRPAGLAQRLPRPASQPHCFHQRRPARGQQARSPGAGAGPAAPGGAVLLLPGFLSGASQYEGLAELLRGRGYATGALSTHVSAEVAEARRERGPTLLGHRRLHIIYSSR